MCVMVNCPTLNKIIYAPVLMPVSGKSYQLESEKAIIWFSVLILDCLNRSDNGAPFIIIQSQSLFVPNLSQQMYQSVKFTFPGFNENFAKFCTEKLKSTIVYNK